jgi:methionyl-tRNA formyltransferase
VAWSELGGQRIRIWKAEVVDNIAHSQAGELLIEQQSLTIGTADKSLKILELQRAGGQKMTTGEFLNANDPAFFNITA